MTSKLNYFAKIQKYGTIIPEFLQKKN